METTSKGLNKPEYPEEADIEVINENMDRINDFGMGFFECTSANRPSSPWVGMQIHETDTDQFRVWTGSLWTLLNRAAEVFDTADSGYPLGGASNSFNVSAGAFVQNRITIPAKPYARRLIIDATVHWRGTQALNVVDCMLYLNTTNVDQLRTYNHYTQAAQPTLYVDAALSGQINLAANTEGVVEVRLDGTTGTGAVEVAESSLRNLKITAVRM